MRWLTVNGFTLFLTAATAVASATNERANNDVGKKKPWFSLSTGNAAYDEAYNLALQEISLNIGKDMNNINKPNEKVFIAGAGWQQLWTRDTSYAVELGAGLLYPEISRTSLEASVEIDRKARGRRQTNSIRNNNNNNNNSNNSTVWLQDECGHFGGWPVLSDAIVGVRGAWSLYLTTGDKEWLRTLIYPMTLRSLKRAERDVYDHPTGLFRGCSSFMESNSGYPEEYRIKGLKVGQTFALSTNLLHYAGYYLGARMAKELDRPTMEIEDLQRKAQQLRDQIRQQMWDAQRGHYAYVMEPRKADNNNGLTYHLLEQMEGLGESLVLIDDDFETDPIRIQRMFDSIHRTPRGIPCLWPRFQNLTIVSPIFDNYHNGRVWPFVQGYWGMAAAKHRQMDILMEELDALVELSKLQHTFAEYYELDGSFPRERARQLWSDTGMVSMIYYGLFGMRLGTDGLTLTPLKPAPTPSASVNGMNNSSGMGDTISLSGVVYRGMTLNIEVSGSGTYIRSCLINGAPAIGTTTSSTASRPCFVNASWTGEHNISIALMTTEEEEEEYNNPIAEAMAAAPRVVDEFQLKLFQDFINIQNAQTKLPNYSLLALLGPISLVTIYRMLCVTRAPA